jgi:ABC-type antimicrobial peptide transport system permease subunit
MSEWLQELRYAIRTLAKTPGFTLVAVLSLALGIGVNTAVLAVGRAVLFQPLNPYFQSEGLGAMHVALKTSSQPGIVEGVRRAVAEVDRDVPVTDLKSQQQQIEETIGSERVLMMLLVFFGIFALLLACIGLHGVTSYAVARRTSEIGIRVALGAQRRDVLWMILRQVVVLAAGGLLIGIPAATAAAKTARALLYGIEPADPWSITLGAGILFLVAVTAGFIPARRAARLDPLVALRRD